MQSKIIGRIEEKRTLEQVLHAPEAQFVAVWGRRRVGKTFLVEEFFRGRVAKTMLVVGIKAEPQKAKGRAIAREGGGEAPSKKQLRLFRLALQRSFYNDAPIPELLSWPSAFEALSAALASVAANRQPDMPPVFVFLDELPWLATPRSGLVEALEHSWNTSLKNFDFLRLVVAGSAASWMLRNIINSRTGLHNRLTAKLNIKPYTLKETQEHLDSRGVALSKIEVLELYMALGGIPYYLNFVRAGETPAQAISRICFGSGPLRNEYELLYASLFEHHKSHDDITRAIASKKKGMTREEILTSTHSASGGTLSTRLSELSSSGFIELIEPLYKNDFARYRLIDPFVLFSLKWIEPAGSGFLSEGDDRELFMKLQKMQEFSVWQGGVFEGICLSHKRQLLEALGLRILRVKMAPWGVRRSQPDQEKTTTSPKEKLKTRPGRSLKSKELKNSAERGAEIDLVIDRDDGAISLCEMKYYSDVFEISEAYGNKLDEKKRIFAEVTRTKKSINTVIIAPNGVKDNAHKRRCVQNIVTIDDLFAT